MGSVEYLLCVVVSSCCDYWLVVCVATNRILRGRGFEWSTVVWDELSWGQAVHFSCFTVPDIISYLSTSFDVQHISEDTGGWMRWIVCLIEKHPKTLRYQHISSSVGCRMTWHGMTCRDMNARAVLKIINRISCWVTAINQIEWEMFWRKHDAICIDR